MNIVIVGGGTAGWLTALIAQKKYPQHDIILIESEKIGILGAGEAGTAQLVTTFNFLDISIEQILKNTKATIKAAAKFSGWSNKTPNFYHPFGIESSASEQASHEYFATVFDASFPASHMYAKINDKAMEDYCMITKICEQGKVPFIKKQNLEKDFFEFYQLANWSFSFDAKLMADFLCSIAIGRGVKRIIADVKNFSINEEGNIYKIHFENRSIDSDFVFDCTGFQRLIIGKLFKSEWKSYKDVLPAKKALPFFLPTENEIPSFIEATAMDYGWMWKTPLQHRQGCGYVFDSDFISDEQAKREIEKTLGFEVEIPKTFVFEPGSYKDVWINNCFAVGLSAGFIEPLEATSLWSAINSLIIFFSVGNSIETKNKKQKENFNKMFKKRTEEIVDFIYLHYTTNKTNTDFWKNFNKNNKMPDFISYILQIIKERPLSQEFDFYGKDTLAVDSYFYLLVGHDFLNKNIMKKYKNLINNNKEFVFYEKIREQNELVSQCIDHTAFLNLFQGQ
jgi:tryptophan halogenase